MENIEYIASFIIICIVFLVFVIGIVANLVKSLKKLKEDGAEIQKEIRKAVIAAIIEAEASGKAGETKKQMVLDSVHAFCETLAVDFDQQKVDDFIEQCIEFYNNMKQLKIKNKKKGDS